MLPVKYNVVKHLRCWSLVIWSGTPAYDELSMDGRRKATSRNLSVHPNSVIRLGIISATASSVNPQGLK